MRPLDIFKGLPSFKKQPNLPMSAPSNRWFSLPGSSRNYKGYVGEGLDNSIVVAVVEWASRNFYEAPISLSERKENDIFMKVFDHDFLELLEYPNPFYTSTVLWQATVVDYNISGNAYWHKVRNAKGKVVELWFIPSTIIEPRVDDRGYPSHYEYTPVSEKNGYNTSYKIPLEDIVHFKNGIDRNNLVKGFSKVQSVLREIFTDDEAANFSASILTNMAIPGVILAPSVIPGAFDQVDVQAQEIKDSFKRNFGGDRRGEPMVLTSPMDVRVLSWSPTELDLKSLRYLPEERICAVIGLHPSVIGLGSGLDRSTFTNYQDAKEAAYENNIIPTQKAFADEIKRSLLSEFIEPNQRSHYKVFFDLTNVRSLSEELTKLYERVRLAVGSGIMSIAEARQIISLGSGPEHQYILRNPSQMPIPIDKQGDPDYAAELAQKFSGNIPGPDTSSIVAAHTDSDLPDLPFPEIDEGTKKPRK